MFKRRDKRIKGCWNPKCKKHKKHFKYKAIDNFCSECRSELIYICRRCGGPLEDKGRKHRVCEGCKAEKQAKAENRKANKDARKEALASVMTATAHVGEVVAEKIKK